MEECASIIIALLSLFAKDRLMIGFGPTGYALLVCLCSIISVRLINLRQQIENPSRNVSVVLASDLHNARRQVCVCVFTSNRPFYPSTFSTPGVSVPILPVRDTSSAVTKPRNTYYNVPCIPEMPYRTWVSGSGCETKMIDFSKYNPGIT